MRIRSCISTPEFEAAVARVRMRPYSDIKQELEQEALSSLERLCKEAGAAKPHRGKRRVRVGRA